jgi:hypothetical protein
MVESIGVDVKLASFIWGISHLGKQMLQRMAARRRSAIFQGLNLLFVMAVTAL